MSSGESANLTQSDSKESYEFAMFQVNLQVIQYKKKNPKTKHASHPNLESMDHKLSAVFPISQLTQVRSVGPIHQSAVFQI